MAVKKKRRRHRHYTGGRNGSLPELAERLTPLEELDPHMTVGGSITKDGRIVVSTGRLKNGKMVGENDNIGPSIFGVERSVVIILVVALTFIAFITWQISRMP
jgi:hypothetical protein